MQGSFLVAFLLDEEPASIVKWNTTLPLCMHTLHSLSSIAEREILIPQFYLLV